MRKPYKPLDIEEIAKRIESSWRHVVYNPKSNKIYLLSDRYRCLDTKADWYDFQDGRIEKRVLTNNRRIRVSKMNNWVYLGEK